MLFCFMLFKVVLTIKSVDETLVCDHSKGSQYLALFCPDLFSIEYAIK